MQDQPFFLFLGDADREGIVSKLKSNGARYVKKRLESSVNNWNKIERHLTDDALQGVIAKMTSYTLSLMISDNYKEISDKILLKSAKKPNLFFIHESFFMEVAEEESREDEYFNYPRFYAMPKGVRDEIKSLIIERGVNVVPYRRNVEITILAQEFIDRSSKNIIFRIYVPNQRMWSKEVEKLLDMFREYLNGVAKFSVRQNKHATGSGIVYELIGDDNLSLENIHEEFDSFSNLLDLCVSSPDAAREFLLSKKFEQRDIIDIVDRYSKEARRLQIDLKQERERRLLSIRHRMEAELADVVTDQADWDHLNAIADAQVPRVSGVGGALGFGGEVVSASPKSVTLNIKPQFIQTVNGVVAQEVSGAQNIGLEASQVIDLIRQHGEKDAAQLVSAVYELEDDRSEVSERISAGARLKGFLYTVANKATDIGVGLLQAYIERKMGLS